MKKVVIVILLMICSDNCFSQYIYEDALKVRSLISGNTFSYNGNTPLKLGENDQLFRILSSYTSNPSPKKVKLTFENNPFLSFGDPTSGSQSSDDYSGYSKELNGSVGSMDVTNLAIGLTDFLIERTKTELNTAFFKRLNDELNEQEDLKTLFPNTVAILSTIGVGIYQYDLYLNSLRTAFEKDLKGLVDNVPEVLENYRDELEQINNWGYPSTALSINMIQWMHRGEQPGDILRMLGENTHMKRLSSQTIPDSKSSLGLKYASNGIRTVSLLSESFRTSASGSEYWVSNSELDKLKDRVVLRIYLGLLYEVAKKDEYKDIAFPTNADGGSITLITVLKDIGDNWDTKVEPTWDFIACMTDKVKEVQNSIDEYEKLKIRISKEDVGSKDRNKQLFDGYYSVFSSTLNLVKHTYRVEELSNQIVVPENAKKVVNYIEYGGDLSVQIVNKQYSGAISSASLLLSEIYAEQLSKNEMKKIESNLASLNKKLAKNKMKPNKVKKDLDDLKASMASASIPVDTSDFNSVAQKLNSLGRTKQVLNPDVSMKTQIVLAEVNETINWDKLPTTQAKLLKYGSFMAALVESESPEQAHAAIETIALPPGSYSIKRESRFYTSLNGYLGGFYGREIIDGADNGNDFFDFNNLALTAPVGVYFGWGNWGKNLKNPWSFGFSIPLVDLGNIASYRFTSGDDQVESIPTIQLKDIVSPGAFLEFGIGGTPLSLGLGAQLGARLRSVEPGADANSIGDMYWRYGFSLKVDIPILNFYSSPASK